MEGRKAKVMIPRYDSDQWVQANDPQCAWEQDMEYLWDFWICSDSIVLHVLEDLDMQTSEDHC